MDRTFILMHQAIDNLAKQMEHDDQKNLVGNITGLRLVKRNGREAGTAIDAIATIRLHAFGSANERDVHATETQYLTPARNGHAVIA